MISGVLISYQLTELPSRFTTFIIILLTLLLLGGSAYFLKQATQSSSRKNHTRISLLTKRLFSDCWLKALNYVVGVLAGVSLVLIQYAMAPSIPNEHFHTSHWIHLKVITPPVMNDLTHYHRIEFEAEMTSLQHLSTERNWGVFRPRIRFNWYLNTADLDGVTLPKVGEHWRFYGHLKSNHAAFNLFSWDYEKWLFQQGILGKVNVSGNKRIEGERNHKLLSSSSGFSTEDIRSNIGRELKKVMGTSELFGIYQALLIGDKSHIEQSQWRLLQDTATIHLMAISGLHMSIVAGMGFVIAKVLWWLFIYRQTRLTFPVFAAAVSAILATVYLSISGAAIPTQRAWVMVLTIIVFLILKRKFQPFSALAFAAFLVLIWDTKSVLNAGFWLSFLAVALIFASLRGVKESPKWHALLGIQFVLSLGLLPVLAFHFFEIPVYGVIANLIAVPFMVFIGLPSLIVTLAVSVFSETVALWLWGYMDSVWLMLWQFIEWVGQLPHPKIPIVAHSFGWLLLAYLGVFGIIQYFVKRRSLPAQFGYVVASVDASVDGDIDNGVDESIDANKRVGQGSIWVGLVVALFVFLLVYFGLVQTVGKRSELRAESSVLNLNVMDVGQGLAIVITTPNHSLIYDAGASWGGKTDASIIAVLPYLKAKGLSHIDTLVISHSDNDHAGGAVSLLNRLSVSRQLSGQPQKVNQLVDDKRAMRGYEQGRTEPRFQPCYAGQNWFWDGFHFEMLAPAKESDRPRKLSDNDSSCLLKISNQHHSILLTGDIGKQQERALIARYADEPETLRSNLLIAGHHGSKHSSSSSWLRAVMPDKVVFSSGYKNRFHFPHSEVIERLSLNKTVKTQWWNTACSGELSFKLEENGVNLQYQARKKGYKWYHHRCLMEEPGD